MSRPERAPARSPSPRQGRSRASALLLAGVLATAGLAGAAPARAQDPALPALVAPIYGQLAALRGRPAPATPPPVVVRTRDETRRFLEQELDRRYSPARLEAERLGMVAWGLVPPDYDLRRLFLDLVQEQLAAYYDPRAKVMVVGDWLTPAEQQAALLHEMVHALQDRDTPLETFLAPDPGRGDQLLARQALVEGEATALMLDAMLRAMGMDLGSLPDLAPLRAQIQSGAGGPAVAQAPPFLRDVLLFPYIEGLAFVHEWRKRHPWSAIGDLYRDPPRSSTHILHPDKRLGAREDPVPVVLPPLDATLPGHRVASEDELGEFALGAVLGLHRGSDEGRRLARGWRGDRYRIWQDDQGRLLLVYLVIMESEASARTLVGALPGSVERRHAAVAGKATARSADITTWAEGGQAFLLERRGVEVLLLEGVPERQAEALREAVWRTRTPAMRP